MKSTGRGTFPFVMAIIGALALMVVCRWLVPDAIYPLERAKLLFVRSVLPRVCGFFASSSAAAENGELRRRIAELEVVRGQLERTQAENDRLRKALDYRSREPQRWLCAGILSSDGGACGTHDTLRVDRGSSSGVRKGAAVVVPEGLVGLVTSVWRHTSEVTLLTDPVQKVSCEARSGSTHIRGILAGGGDDRLVLMHLRNAARVEPRARVLTTGLGGVFPRGLEVGTLVAVTNGIHGIEGVVAPAVDYSTLEDVFICCDR